MFHHEKTLADIIAECDVAIVSLKGEYIKVPSARRVRLQCDGRVVGITEFVKSHYEKLSYECLEVESVPFHVLFGVFMWLLIEDLDDDRLQLAGFGERGAYEHGEKGRMIWAHKPDDFGTSGYGERRKGAIDRHFAEILRPEELDWLFEYWLDPSENLRQYLWAHRSTDVDRARRLLAILPREPLMRILRYLIDSYWTRYLGWPDLILFREGEYFFAEIKSSSDKLSDEQKRWIRDNHAILKLPFKLVKVCKSSAVRTQSEGNSNE